MERTAGTEDSTLLVAVQQSLPQHALKVLPVASIPHRRATNSMITGLLGSASVVNPPPFSPPVGVPLPPAVPASWLWLTYYKGKVFFLTPFPLG